MKALHFLGIFIFALRWHEAEYVVRFIAAELFLNQVRYFWFHIWTGERFQYLRQNKKND